MKYTLKYMAVVAGFAAAGAAAAADITLFENDNYNGRRLRSTTSVSNLDNSGFNDRASSVVIHNGQWQICSDAYFRGRCVTLGPGDYPSLRSMDLNDSVSSVRDLWDHAGRNPPVVGGGGGANLILYDGYDLGGNSYPVGGFIANLDGSGFNDRAQSMIVYDGTWELCEDSDFRGSCLVYGPGRYANLGGLGGRVSSLRPARGAGGGLPGGGLP
ncbi:MAG: beta/gamma crystallin family protein, partial [Aromatoleum sp.]|nr:beta/gamma crystallin family protein [Aromatoleum sp.]